MTTKNLELKVEVFLFLLKEIVAESIKLLFCF